MSDHYISLLGYTSVADVVGITLSFLKTFIDLLMCNKMTRLLRVFKKR